MTLAAGLFGRRNFIATVGSSDNLFGQPNRSEKADMQSRQSRRRLLATLSSAAGVSLIGSPNVFAQQAPPETSRIRLSKSAAICVAPQYVAEDLLRAEGFTDVEYVLRPPAALAEALGRGEVDLAMHFSPPCIVAIDAGQCPSRSWQACTLAASNCLRMRAFAAFAI
jgi:ABC-type nitrate/sulfonate/bicarbonate transport system substrate-binding protein